MTITSPAVQGEQTAVTDANGYYRVGNLPPGDYTVRLDKEEYKPYSRTGINLRADVTIRIDSELLPEALKEEIVVVAEAPTVDVGSSNTGLNVTNDFARRVPIVSPGSSTGGAVRSYEAVAEATPQTKTDTYGTSINGTTSPENNFSVDGLSRNSAGFGTNGARLSMEFVKEVNVLTAGYMPEYGTAGGGILSAVTKSGSNEYHGGAWLFVSPGGLEGERNRINRTGQTLTTQRSLKGIGDIGVEVGGPIVKDKLWFYTGFMYARTEYNLKREVVNQVSGPVADQTRDYSALRDDYQVFGKLTYAVDNRNRLTASAYVLPSTSGGNNRFAIDPQTGVPAVSNIAGTVDALANRVKTNTISAQLAWDSEAASKKVLFKTTVGYMHQLEETGANDGTLAGDKYGLAATPGVAYRRNNPTVHSLGDFEPLPSWACGDATTAATQCPITSYRLGGPGQLSTKVMDRWQARSMFTFFGELAGRHVVKGGIDLDFSQYASTVSYAGSDLLRESTRGTSFSDFRNYGYLTAPDQRVLLDSLHWKTHSLFLGGFLQDGWSIADRVTINAGVRYDAQILWGGDNAVFMTLPNEIAPRVGAVWDPTSKGKSKLYGNFSRYYQPVPLDVVNRGGSSEPQASASRSAKNCNPADAAQRTGACQDPANFLTIGDPQSPDQKYSLIGAGKTPVDPDLKAPYSDEIVLGGEYDVFKNARVGVSYTRRWTGRVIEDVSRDEAQTYFITNPGEGATSDFPKPERTYDAGTIFFQKTFGNNWDALVSYTLSYLRGNWAGLFRPETGQIDPFANADFDLKSLTINRKGPLPGDSRHAIKAFGSRTFDITAHDLITVGGAVRATSGGPTSYLGSHPLYGADEVFILGRGEGNRLPWTYSFDTSIGYTAKLGAERTITVSMDVFNLFNFQEITQRDERYTSSDVNPIPGGKVGDLSKLKTVQNTLLLQKEVNPNFSQPTAFQSPRQIRFGIRGSF